MEVVGGGLVELSGGWSKKSSGSIRHFHTNFRKKRNFRAAGANSLPPFNFFTFRFAVRGVDGLPVSYE